MDAVEKLIIKDDLRNNLGRNGRDFVKQNFNWDKNIIEMINTYRKINK